MTEIAVRKKPETTTFEAEIKEFEKQIKLLLWLGEMKARIEHVRKEDEEKGHIPMPQDPLIKVRRNRNPPFSVKHWPICRSFTKDILLSTYMVFPKNAKNLLTWL